jgi:hypothetical protein
MQGENWSPNGEANELIQARGLCHTSMSMGDVIQAGDEYYQVACVGFRKIPSRRVSVERERKAKAIVLDAMGEPGPRVLERRLHAGDGHPRLPSPPGSRRDRGLARLGRRGVGFPGYVGLWRGFGPLLQAEGGGRGRQGRASPACRRRLVAIHALQRIPAQRSHAARHGPGAGLCRRPGSHQAGAGRARPVPGCVAARGRPQLRRDDQPTGLCRDESAAHASPLLNVPRLGSECSQEWRQLILPRSCYNEPPHSSRGAHKKQAALMLFMLKRVVRSLSR